MRPMNYRLDVGCPGANRDLLGSTRIRITRRPVSAGPSLPRCEELAGQREFFELAVEGASGDAEGFGGFGFITVGLSQRIFDDAALTFLDIADRLAADLVAVAGGILLQVHL